TKDLTLPIPRVTALVEMRGQPASNQAFPNVEERPRSSPSNPVEAQGPSRQVLERLPDGPPRLPFMPAPFRPVRIAGQRASGLDAGLVAREVLVALPAPEAPACRDDLRIVVR